jgi:hypothetical protein
MGPLSFVTACDWSPFFHRVRHFGPVLACGAAAVTTEPSRPISTLD